MLMNPPMAEDLNVLARYLTSNAAGRATESEPYVRVSSTARDDSIVYLSLPRQRRSAPAREPRNEQEPASDPLLPKAKGCKLR